MLVISFLPALDCRGAVRIWKGQRFNPEKTSSLYLQHSSFYFYFYVFNILLLCIQYFTNVLFLFYFEKELLFKKYRKNSLFKKYRKNSLFKKYRNFFWETGGLFSSNKSHVHYPKWSVICFQRSYLQSDRCDCFSLIFSKNRAIFVFGQSVA